MGGHAVGTGAALGGQRRAPSTNTAGWDESDPALQRLKHDLRQPLAAISWSVQSIDGTSDMPVDLRTALEQIGRHAAWMDRLLVDALDELAGVAVVDLADALADSCSWASPCAEYDVSFTERDQAPVLVDPVGLERAARNLMDNAMRAVAGGGRIEVSVSAPGTTGVLEIADSGPGFGALSPRHGHGLVGVRRFVERFGGELVCGTSSLGGALVQLVLPRAVGW